MSVRFPRQARVRARADFDRIFAQGRRAATPRLAVHWHATPTPAREATGEQLQRHFLDLLRRLGALPPIATAGTMPPAAELPAADPSAANTFAAPARLASPDAGPTSA